MKKIISLAFLFSALTGMAQTMFNNPLVIGNGQAPIDGKGGASYFYAYTGNDSVWTASYANISDNETIMINYTKTTAKDCMVTFPAGSVIAQPVSMPGVVVSGLKFTLSSSEKGAFQILVTRAGSAYNVQITRLAQ